MDHGLPLRSHHHAHSPRRFLPRSLRLVSPGVATAQTMTVTTTADIVDFPAPQTAAQLPGPDGVVSFREAVLAMDNTAGPQVIAFAIPRSLWNDQFFPGRAMLDMDGPIVIASDDNLIDFTTQASFSGDTNPAGNEVGMQYYGPPSNISFIFLHGNRNTIRGLDATTGNAFGASINVSGNDNLIESCTSASIFIDGGFSGPVARGNIIRGNTLSTVEITCWADENTVVGNRLTHVRVEGSQYCVYPTANRIGGPCPAGSQCYLRLWALRRGGLPHGIAG